MTDIELLRDIDALGQVAELMEMAHYDYFHGQDDGDDVDRDRDRDRDDFNNFVLFDFGGIAGMQTALCQTRWHFLLKMRRALSSLPDAEENQQ